MAGIFIQKHVQSISTFKKVVVIYAQENESKGGYEVFNDCEYVFYYKKGIVSQLNYLIAFAKAFLFVKKKLGTPAVIHLQVAYPAGIVAVVVAFLYRIPLILTEHWTGYMDADGRYEKLSFLMKWFIKKSFSMAERISVVSTSLKQVIVEKKLSTPEKLVLVYNTLQSPSAENIRRIDFESDDVKALTVAHLTDAHKNISLLINAVELVVKQYPNFKLTIVGGGPESEKFIELAKTKNLLMSHIVFTGY
jgi:glycosyltransferase involved in cell wall biosynthesis